MLQARAGVDLFDHLSLGATLLGVPGREEPLSFCGGGLSCYHNASFRAISGFASARLRTSGEDLKIFGEAGIGVGHLISLSEDDLFENPPLHGRVGLAYLLGFGGRLFVTRKVAVGLALEMTTWTQVGHVAYTYGVQEEPAASDIAVSAFMVLLSVAFAPFR